MTGSRDSLAVRNLTALSIDVISLGASKFDMAPQVAGGFNRNSGWKPIFLA
jgi:hypothetical protein